MDAFRISAVVGFLAVALGAFGAHALKAPLMANGTVDIWHTGSTYHLVHAVVLLAITSREPRMTLAWSLFVVGIAIFSGSLYLLALTNVKWLGAITPIGGLCLLGGWLVLAVKGLRS